MTDATGLTSPGESSPDAASTAPRDGSASSPPTQATMSSWPPPEPDALPCPGGCGHSYRWHWKEGPATGPSFRRGAWRRPDAPLCDACVTAEAEASRPAVWPPPQPSARPCAAPECDTPQPYVWADGPWNGPSWARGRWMAPDTILCHTCASRQRAEAERREALERIEASGLPAHLRAFRWKVNLEYTDRQGRAVPELERDSITHAAFQRFQNALPDGTLGITPWNKSLARILCAMCLPSVPVQSWLMVGPVGSGKSTLMAATITGLLERGVEARYITETDLWALVRAQWRETRRSAHRVDVLQALIEVPVLALDDLGTVQQPKPYHREGMERLICGRYDRGLPILITTNCTISQIAEHYGERVASRLSEMIDRRTRYKLLTGPDWRTGMVRPSRPTPAASSAASCSECGFRPCRCG